MRLETEALSDPFALELDFDINAAFQEVTTGILSDKMLTLEEKVGRVETLIAEASSETYQAFVDFRAMASQIEMFCNHDHALNESLTQNSTVSGFMDSHKDYDHNHDSVDNTSEESETKNSKEKSKKKKKKDRQKKRRSWFGFYY